MSRSAVSAVCLMISALMLSACGFRPLYGKMEDGTNLDDRLATVEIQPVPGRYGREFKVALDSQMYPSGRPASSQTRYLLEIRLNADREGLAIQPDASITRYDYKLTGRYKLIEVGSKKVAHHGIATAETAYNVVESQFATLAARQDAEDRAIRSLSEEIRLRIALFLRTGAAPRGTEPLVKKK